MLKCLVFVIVFIFHLSAPLEGFNIHIVGLNQFCFVERNGCENEARIKI